MNYFRNTVTALLLLISVLSDSSKACTTFLLSSGDALVYGRNYDWNIGYGLVMTNLKDVKKTAYTADKNPAQWISKYGSVTFNQFGKEFPTGGMNEAGLVVELMWLDGTEYPTPDERPAVGGILQWIQYQLDNHATVEEVIASDSRIRIPAAAVPVHFLVADRNGDCASIEFLQGKLVYNTGAKMKYKVLANDTYSSSQKYAEENISKEFLNDINYERSSLNRFTKACNMISEFFVSNSGDPVEYSFDILNSVSQGASTQWSIVYDIKNLEIHFKSYSSPNIKVLEIHALNFSCTSQSRILNIDFEDGGTVNPYLKEYNTSANRSLIELSYNGVEFLKEVPKESRDRTAAYPEKLSCSSN